MTYTPALRAQREALVLRLIAVRDEYDAEWIDSVLDRLCERIGARPYDLIEDGQQYATVWCSSSVEALAEARDGVDRANYTADDNEGDAATLWIDVTARDLISGERDSDTVTLEPEAPDCEDGHEHDWQNPLQVVGGLAENPGVFGHGGGVRIHTVCRHCGCYRVLDTWAQRPDTGEQGLETVEYRCADERSLEWIESLQGETEA